MRIVALVLALMLVTPAAHAGGWAATYLDPLPAAFEADKTYTVGYWVLQHGSHPYEGDLGETGLIFAGGPKPLRFIGTPLPQAAHYAVAVALPAGRYQVFAQQGMFASHEVGMLTVPGSLEIKPVDQTNVRPWLEAGKTWDSVRPPMVPAPAPVASVTPEPPGELPIGIAVAVLVGFSGVYLLVRRLRKGW